jgi:stress response protein YsnF
VVLEDGRRYAIGPLTIGDRVVIDSTPTPVASPVATRPAAPVARPPAPLEAARQAPRPRANGDLLIPVSEELLDVGKRQIDAGGKRLTSHVEAQAVDKNIALREEEISVERRRVDRQLAATEADAFGDRTFAIDKKTEVPVIEKRARVVEEIYLEKETTERVETVCDNLRHTEVEVVEVKPRRPS